LICSPPQGGKIKKKEAVKNNCKKPNSGRKRKKGGRYEGKHEGVKDNEETKKQNTKGGTGHLISERLEIRGLIRGIENRNKHLIVWWTTPQTIWRKKEGKRTAKECPTKKTNYQKSKFRGVGRCGEKKRKSPFVTVKECTKRKKHLKKRGGRAKSKVVGGSSTPREAHEARMGHGVKNIPR